MMDFGVSIAKNDITLIQGHHKLKGDLELRLSPLQLRPRKWCSLYGKKRLNPPLRMLPYIFSLQPKKREDCRKQIKDGQKSFLYLSSLTSTFWCCVDKEIAIVQLYPDIPQLSLLPCSEDTCNNFHIGTKVVTTPATVTNLRQVIRYVSVPTWYLTENGPVELPIDIDRCIIITPQLETIGGHFSRMVGDQLWTLVNQTCMQYLP